MQAHRDREPGHESCKVQRVQQAGKEVAHAAMLRRGHLRGNGNGCEYDFRQVEAMTAGT